MDDGIMTKITTNENVNKIKNWITYFYQYNYKCFIIANLFFYKIPLIVDHAKLMTHLFEN